MKTSVSPSSSSRRSHKSSMIPFRNSRNKHCCMKFAMDVSQKISQNVLERVIDGKIVDKFKELY